MPQRPLSPCTNPGCPELVARPGRCHRHGREADKRRGTARQRGYDTRWERTRKAFLRTHPRCQQPDCDQRATDIDHIDGLGPKGPRGHDWTNLRSLCHSHHSQRTARDQPGGFRLT